MADLWPTVAFSGHRDLTGYDQAFIQEAIDHVQSLLIYDRGTRKVTCGLSWGGDLDWGVAAVGNPALAVLGFLPYPAFGKTFTAGEKVRQRYVIDGCHQMYFASVPGDRKTFAGGVFARRNEMMLDVSDALVALWDGRPAGDMNRSGTASTVRKARERGLPVVHINPVERTVEAL